MFYRARIPVANSITVMEVWLLMHHLGVLNIGGVCSYTKGGGVDKEEQAEGPQHNQHHPV